MTRFCTSAAGLPKPAKLEACRFLSARPARKTLRVSGAPLAPRYSPVKGLTQEAAQLKPAFVVKVVTPAVVVLMSGDAKPRALILSLESLAMKFGWLKTLKTSILISTRIDSLLGILNAFKIEMSKSVSPLVRPALRARFPLRNWKSTWLTLLPVMLSLGPDPLEPAGARNVVCSAAQFGEAGGNTAGAPGVPAGISSAGLLHAATPAWLMAMLEPAFDAMLVATSAPTGAPAQPGSVEPAAQIFGRWLVSEPSAGKADPENPPEPVETGYGRPVWIDPMKANVQSLTAVPTNRMFVSFSVSNTKLKLAR